jgi:phytoene dehydrogenase-like protein
MSRLIPPEACDVVVIGAGMGGLVASALLANAGLDVLVCDPQPRAGGYLAGFRHKDFVFDSAIHWLNQCGPGGSVYRILDFLGEDHPKCQPLKEIRRYKGQTFDELLTDDPDVLKRDWLERFPGEREGIERFFRDAYEIGQGMMNLARLMRTPASMNLFELALSGIRLGLYSRPFLSKYKLSGPEGLDLYFKEDGIKQVFATETDFMSIIVPIGWAYHHDYQAAPEGGSQAFPRWLVKHVEANGSRVMLGRGASRIQVEKGRAVGVMMEAKPRRNLPEQLVRCSHVIATNDILTLYKEMLPANTVSAARMAKLESMEMYSSSVTLSIGLNCPAEELGFGAEMMTLTRDDVPLDQQNCGEPELASITVLAPSVRDASLAPADKGTLTIYISADIEHGDYWKTGAGLERGDDYRNFKEAYADAVLKRVEREIGTDLRGHIEVLKIATPVTHWRYTGNHRGSLMGGRPSQPNFRNRVAGYRTPVKNLLLGGHWAEYGGGVPIAARAGSNAALLVLKQANRAEFRRLRAAMGGR